VNFMAPKRVCRIMHALNKGTLDETFIIRQIVDAIMISQNLLPPSSSEGNSNGATRSSSPFMKVDSSDLDL